MSDSSEKVVSRSDTPAGQWKARHHGLGAEDQGGGGSGDHLGEVLQDCEEGESCQSM